MKSMFTGRSRLPMTALPMLVTALVSTNLDADTVAWYHFDEVAPGAPVTSNVRFLNSVDSTKLSGTPYSVGVPGKTPPQYTTLGDLPELMPVATNNIDDTIYVIDPVSGTKNETGRSLYFTYADDETNNKPARYGGCVQVSSDSSLSLQTVTVEFFVLPVRLTERTDNGWHLVGKQSSANGKFTYSISLDSLGRPYVNCYDNNGSRVIDVNNFRAPISILDDKWHHVAFTASANASGTVLKLYVDYVLVKSATMDSPLYYVDESPLYIGGSQMGWYVPGGFIDEVRISNTVLEPLQFLKYTADTRFHAGFEGSFNADVPHLIDLGVGIGTAGRIVPEMSLPAFTNCVPGRYVVDGAGDSMRTNALSVLLEGGYIKYPHNTELEMPEMTVECFMKHHASSNYAGILRFSKSNLDVTDPIWFVGVESGRLFMRIDTATKENAGNYFGATFFDGRWHHLGVTFSTNGLGQAVVRVYDNYRQVGTDWTLDGPLDFSKGSVLHVGRSSNQKYLFYGCIDEVRISRGVLDPDDFLRVFNGGLNVILR